MGLLVDLVRDEKVRNGSLLLVFFFSLRFCLLRKKELLATVCVCVVELLEKQTMGFQAKKKKKQTMS